MLLSGVHPFILPVIGLWILTINFQYRMVLVENLSLSKKVNADFKCYMIQSI